MTDPQAETVQLLIPCRPEYVGVARLAVLGIASRMPFSYDEVEDVRLAVGEACTHAVERAGDDAATIRIVSTRGCPRSDHRDQRRHRGSGCRRPCPKRHSFWRRPAWISRGWARLLMEILVDEVEIETTATGTRVLLTKYAPE